MLSNDVRFALRSLRRAPAFTAAAIACLALGVGASTAIFSIVSGVLLRPLPYQDSARLIRVFTEFPNFPNGGLHKFWASPPEFRELQRQTDPWGQLEAWVTGPASLEGGSQPLRVNLTYVSGGLMSMLGTAPSLGRGITLAADDPGVQQQVVLSDSLWRTAFGGSPAVVGRETQLDGQKAVIVGVMPRGFDFPPGSAQPADAYVPLQLSARSMTQYGSHFLSLVGRLKPGVSLQQARAYLPRIHQALGVASSAQRHVINEKNHPLSAFGFHDEVIGDTRPAMLMLLGAVGFFLLIACVNVSSLLLARADSRRREIAVRRAIGAGAIFLARQFAVEGLVLAGLGGALGVGLAYLGVRALAVSNAGLIPRIREIAVDWQVLAFALGISLVAGLVFCMAPMLQSLRTPLSICLGAASGRAAGSAASSRMRSALVVAEISLAMVLLVGAGLLGRALLNLGKVDPGFRPDSVLTAQLSLSSQAFNDRANQNSFRTRLEQRLRVLPGVQFAALASGLPPERRESRNDTMIENFVPRPGGPIQNVTFYQQVAGNFFEAVGARLVEGRFFNQSDGADSAPVVIVNQTMAEQFWPGQSAIGKRLQPGGARVMHTVVGVVRDLRNGGLANPAGTELFVPYAQYGGSGTTYVVLRTQGDPARMASALRNAVREVDPNVPVSRILPMEAVMGEAKSQPRFLTFVLAVFSVLAVILAALGIYGVISFSVARRTPEFGIRMALGAQSGDVRSLVLREGLLLSGLGLGLGLAGSFLATRSLQSLLFQVTRFDPVTFAAVAGLLLVVALTACLIPARRATGTDPMRALRNE